MMGHRRKITILIVVAILLVGAVYVGTRYFSKPNSDQAQVATNDKVNQINFGPPTEEEKAEADKVKQDIVNQQNKEGSANQQGNVSNKKTASVIITDAGQYEGTIEVRSFIPDHYQDGVCTITFTQGNKIVTKDTPAYRDVSTTICTNPLFPRTEFPAPGEWQVVVSYSSENATGKSTLKTITID